MESDKIKKLYLPTLLVAASLFSFLPDALPAPRQTAADHFRKKMENILAHPCLKNNHYGIEVYSLEKKEVLFAAGNGDLFIPASNLKLITTAAALEYLGPDYRFITRLYSPGRLEGDTLFGDLYIKGFGDPKLVTEQMWLLVNALKGFPIKKIVGNILADDSFFDSRLRLKTWGKNPGPQAYNAPLGALSFNFNTVTVYISPGLRSGERPRVIVEPDTPYVRVDNQARTLARGEKPRLSVNRVHRGGHDEITVRGGIPLGHSRKRYFINITNPTEYTLHVFQDYLVRAGIEVVGKTGRGTVPGNARLLVTHRSEPLSLVLRGLNKFSNNLIAEQVLKTMAAERFGPPGTTENGLKIIREYMQSLGYADGQYRIVDGSGLSRQNRLSPGAIIRVLKHVRKDLSLYPEFISALGVMGVDGNVKKRMNGVKNSQRARVKTGTLNSVSALSGYFQSRDGELFAFSILMNDLSCHNGQAMEIQDKIVQEGLKFQRGENPGNPGITESNGT
ncbi:MAG: D-alanyl-D-alanine carboxypeptidase/D-alanyl-D-alanine-endopeptidase [Nitrospinaceae bacterium]